MNPTRGNNSPAWNSTFATTLRAAFQLAAVGSHPRSLEIDPQRGVEGELKGLVLLLTTAPVQCYVLIPFPGCSFESGLKHNFLDKCPDTGTSPTIDFHQPASASLAYPPASSALLAESALSPLLRQHRLQRPPPPGHDVLQLPGFLL